MRHELGFFETWEVMSRNVWGDRELIWQLFKRDFFAAYRESVVGHLECPKRAMRELQAQEVACMNTVADRWRDGRIVNHEKDKEFERRSVEGRMRI